MKKRTILTSLMSVAMLATIASGATYALFTAEDTTNIAVNAAKVSVSAEVENLTLFSMDKEFADSFENGGTAAYKDGVLTLENITPGDKVEFDIRVTNSSNIDIQYKMNWEVTGKLAEALEVKADDKDLQNSSWTKWAAASVEKEKVIKMMVELPVDAGDDYQEQSCNVIFAVEAIQANGILNDYVTPSTLADALANAQEGDEIKLAAGYYDEIVIPQNGMKILSEEGAVVGFLNVNGKANVTLQGLTFDAAGAKNVYDGSGTKRAAANIAGSSGKNNNNGAHNLLIDNCKFIGESPAAVCIAFTDRGRSTSQSGNVTISNCKFEATNCNYFVYGYYTGVKDQGFTFVNNVFETECNGRPIYLGKYASNTPVVVKGNIFKTTESIESSVSLQAHSSIYTVSIDALENTFKK